MTNTSTTNDFQHDVPQGGAHILIVDDDAGVRSSIETVLRGLDYHVTSAEDGDRAEKILETNPPDLILLDMRMPNRGGLGLLRTWLKIWKQIPVILMSGEATVSEALKGLQEGAFDFIEKPLSRQRLVNSVARALERVRLIESKENDEPEMVGNSSALRKIVEQVAQIAKTKARVLVTGESGTGKDLVARAIHRLSARKNARFLKLNCAAIPSELIESELFGHAKGAFTGAVQARKGLFVQADAGTLFLDEVGDLSLSAQAKLLRVLQNGEVNPIGSTATIQVDVRVISATHRNLKSLIEQGLFREDLYYRLAVIEVNCPALKDRPDDIPFLVESFMKSIQRENSLPPKTISKQALDVLQSYPWPGNIRELRNTIERVMILGSTNIDVADLPTDIRNGAISRRGDAIMGEKIISWEEFKNQSEKNYLLKALRHHDGHIPSTATALGVERSTVHKWMKSLQISQSEAEN